MGIEKPESGSMEIIATKPIEWRIILIRLVALFATLSATIVMVLNKESKTFVIATVGTKPVTATITAKFQHTPANVFFVIANGMASLHNFLMIVMAICLRKCDFRGLRSVYIAVSDMLNVALVSAGVNAAAFMAELAKNGNTHARWNEICSNFDTFCDHGAGALISSFIGVGFMLVISIISILSLHKPVAVADRPVVPHV
ncbi:Casparian strip membrane protein domain [Dillenia turbinata]|uniref:CASP-like protein n=1 Tax=Dillenia turbinata TaxID=194707 RepID=A0AAN8USQ2_9MAGN